MTTTREIVSDSLRYWERKRLWYNAALLVVTCAAAALMLPMSEARPVLPTLVSLGICAAVANLLFCAAYPIDVFVQHSGFREEWRRHRYWLFLAGTGFAAFLALGASVGLFLPIVMD